MFAQPMPGSLGPLTKLKYAEYSLKQLYLRQTHYSVKYSTQIMLVVWEEITLLK